MWAMPLGLGKRKPGKPWTPRMLEGEKMGGTWVMVSGKTEGCLGSIRKRKWHQVPAHKPRDLPRPGECCLGPPYQQRERELLSQVSDAFMAKAVLGRLSGERGTGFPACRVHRDGRNEARICVGTFWGFSTQLCL